MLDPRRSLIALGLAGGLACGGGCSGAPGADSRTEEATVRGTITVLGNPATKGQLVFDPTNVSRPDAGVRTAQIGPDGTYKVTTLVGPNSVSVSVPKPPRPMAGMTPELGLDVRPGENTLDIKLPQSD